MLVILLSHSFRCWYYGVYHQAKQFWLSLYWCWHLLVNFSTRVESSCALGVQSPPQAPVWEAGSQLVDQVFERFLLQEGSDSVNRLICWWFHNWVALWEAVETGKGGLGGVLGRPVQGISSLPVYGLGWLSWSTMMWTAALSHTLLLVWDSSQLRRAIFCSYTWLTRVQVLLQGPSTLLAGVKSSQPHFLDAVLADRHFCNNALAPDASLAGFRWDIVFLCDVDWSIVII